MPGYFSLEAAVERPWTGSQRALKYPGTLCDTKPRHSNADTHTDSNTTTIDSVVPILPSEPDAPFPDVRSALRDPNGLLAMGGDLSRTRLINAYHNGIFPWYSHGQPLLWWSPDPRSVLMPEQLKISRSLRKTIRKGHLSVTFDRHFPKVMAGCAQPRGEETETWITSDMFYAYNDLHLAGYAHSVETWLDGELVGGLYGVAMGQVFFGESMFHRVSDASKVAMVALADLLLKRSFRMIDCQVETQHLNSLGAENIPREDFLEMLDHWIDAPAPGGLWSQIDYKLSDNPLLC